MVIMKVNSGVLIMFSMKWWMFIFCCSSERNMVGLMFSDSVYIMVLLKRFDIMVMKVSRGMEISSVMMCGRISRLIGFRLSVWMVLIFLLVFIELICVVKELVVCLVIRMVVSRMVNLCRKENVIRFIV